MESRDTFLSSARDNHNEFSTLRRAQHSTMALLVELSSPTISGSSSACAICGKSCGIRYYAVGNEDKGSCSRCYSIMK